MIRLEVAEGHSPGQTFELDAAVSVIGRSPDCEVALAEGHVSGRHARLVAGLDAVTLEDLGSTNGTAILREGERIQVAPPGEVFALRDGDVVELGRDDEVCRLRVHLVDDERTATLVSIRTVDQVGSTAEALQSDPVTLRALFQAQAKIGRASALDEVMNALVDVVFELVAHATHVTIVLRKDDRAHAAEGGAPAEVASYLPVLSRARAATRPGDFVPVTRSVYRKVLRERAAVLAADAPKEVGASASIMGASVRSTLAVPLWRGDDILGVVQVDNRDAPGMLKSRDLDVLLIVAENASLAIANARLINRLTIAEEQLRSENRFLKDREAQRRTGGAEGGRQVQIIGESSAMRALLGQLDKVVNTNVTVLIEGETGTGKELVASALHYRSRRRDRLFVAQNCAALAETLLESELFGHKKGSFTGAHEDKKGLFELADGATLFLDEITEAPMSIQSKLLRVLQEGEIRPVGAAEPKTVNVRVVAATNRNLEQEVGAGRFREDLYYRLKVFPLVVPPLRERRTDIALLTRHFLARYSKEIGKVVAGISDEALGQLVAYDWPGNVRELQNEIQRAVIQVDEGSFVTPDLLSSRMRRGEQVVARAGGAQGTLRETMAVVEKYLLLEALRAHDNNKTAAARALGITREGLHKKLRHL